MAKFKLQTVLDYRERLEGLAQQAHAAALEKENQLLEQLTGKRQELAALHEEFEDRQRQGLSVHEFALYSNHIGHIMGLLASLLETWETARDELERKRQALCLASQERQLLEKLKEKHLCAERADALHKEALQLDEIAVQHFKR